MVGILAALLVFMLQKSDSLNYNCNTPSCATCSSGLNYLSKSCLSTCPQGYLSNGVSCQCSSCSLTLFSVSFYQYRDFSANTVGVFRTPSNLAFSDSSQAAPIPTKERGFYFATTSSLISNTIGAVGPDFSIALAIRVTNCTKPSFCTVFTLSNSGTDFFSIQVNSSQLVSTWSLSNSGTITTNTLTTDFEFGQ